MSEQLNLFPGQEGIPDGEAAELEIDIGAVDELFLSKSHYRNSREYMALLKFISGFPTYSFLNCFLLYTQNPSLSFIATAKTWVRKYRRKPKPLAHPFIILAPMSPVRFVFDVKDTEGEPLPTPLLDQSSTTSRISKKVYENTIHNCAVQGISIRELSTEDGEPEGAARITPSIQRKFGNLDIESGAKYLVVLNRNHRLEQRYAALVCELGHIFCGHLGIDSDAWWAERKGLDMAQIEIEAGSVAFLACRRRGLIDNSVAFLSAYAEADREMPMFSLNAVFQATGYIEDMARSRWSKPKRRGRY